MCNSKRRPLCLLKPKNELPATVHDVLRLGRDSGRSFAEMVASVTDNILPVNIDAVKFWAQLYYNAPPRKTEDPSLSHRLHFSELVNIIDSAYVTCIRLMKMHRMMAWMRMRIFWKI